MSIIITQEERRVLLRDAREVITATLEHRLPAYRRETSLKEAIKAGTSALAQRCGAFVTIHKGKSLRGCIGRMIAADTLEKTVQVMALEAAFGDPRFPPLAGDELEECGIEISVLSPMEICPDPQSIELGLHGLYLVHQGHSGVFLPQVPGEQGWSLEEYLDNICLKAGLRPGAYREPGAKLYTFTAVVFGEEGEDR
jgi:AmmeMemoRadiSam system protein A